jgi:hypothetical protein
MTQADRVFSTPPTNTSARHSRRSILGAIAGSAAAAGSIGGLTPAIAAASEPDPILAAIEAHKRAYARFDDSVHHHSKLEDELPSDLRESFITKWDNVIVETDDPRWILAEAEVAHASSVEADAAIELINVKPVTIAGVLALVDYVTHREQRGGGWPLVVDDDDKPRSWHFFLLKNIAAALDMAVHS